ncbi:chaperonin 10-like protein [Vararia minispora EC-137]|uniref:Chaperonin 10-like protein n=1 Tax=Vararia minispora EC-137 TaxID=1314806 RepID=A0ACB8QME5_9AGAM|nr:chaperonin 10-like protein [Vararia minispora EC-137]
MSFEYSIFSGSENGDIVVKKTERPFRPNDVIIKITHTGLCYTDVHQRKRDMALGHEGVGIVERIGPDVQTIEVGDRVGFSVVRDTCRRCKECLAGEDMYCVKPDIYSHPTGSTNLGSLASHAVISETFVFCIPEAIDNLYAGPLMCAGATVFEPLYRYGVRAGERVGIVGVGGLGHLAIQFANKMGCEVVVFSSTDSKRDEACELGAHEFHTTKGKEKLEGVKPIKYLLVTTSSQPDWGLFVPIMDTRSTIFPLTVSEEAFDISSFHIITKGMRIQGSDVAPRSVYHALLDFAAAQGIKPMVKQFPLTKDGIEKAFAAIEDGSLRYRAVLVAQD